MRRVVLLVLILAVCSACVPAIIGLSATAGGITVAATYEILGASGAKDAGAE